MKFYRHAITPARFSQVMQQPQDIRDSILSELYKSEKQVEIISYCFMPNHFHFLLKQKKDKGVSNFISNFANAYTKYFNTKEARVGPLFQGTFKAVLVETDEQLIHLSRYIHLNPVVSNIISTEDLPHYKWSSYPIYLSSSNEGVVNKELVLDLFKSSKDYEQFVLDQVDYGRKLEEIKHLLME